ncbi:MAG: MopE-related protein [Myxococcota bacterium]|nr:MopE-related protein [Myxococcota bacterium]
MPIALLFSILSGCAWISADEHKARLDPDGDDVLWPHDCDDTDSEIGELTWYFDNDGDGYGGGSGEERCEGEEGETTRDGDCDDTNPDIHPNAIEFCNEIDDNCDGETDNNPGEQRWYRDVDADGWGTADEYVLRTDCAVQPGDYTQQSGDCNDYNSTIYPGADEYCDDEDTDCDEDTRDPHSVDALPWHPDVDGDGFGDMYAPIFDCDQPEGLMEDASDCNDQDATININGQEVCDEDDQDEDCDGAIDDADDTVDPSTYKTLYEDLDDDGFGSLPVLGCDPQDFQAANAGDCDDTRADISPAGTEICDPNNEDEDCDGLRDDADDSLSAASTIAHYADSDGDGYGDTTAVFLCDPTTEYPTTDNSDCDDTRADISPAGVEVCDDLDEDEDCDGAVDSADDNVAPDSFQEWYQDGDGDGYGSTSAPQTACDPPPGYGSGTGDCDDTDPTISPDATEIWYDGVDQDCNGVDDYDADGDGYRSDSHPDLGGSYGTDCDDAVFMVNPGLDEICNDGWDNDCDATTDLLCGLQSEISVIDAEASFIPEGSSDEPGLAVGGGQDLNLDGLSDIIIGAPGFDGVAPNAGAAYVFYGPITGATDLASADLRILGVGTDSFAGTAVTLLDDMTGDGIADIGVGAYNRLGDMGTAYVIDGTATGPVSVLDATYSTQFFGSSAGDMLGYSMANVGDFNADGSADWLVGAPAIGSGNPGEAYLLYGPLTSVSYDPSTADVQISGEQADDLAGYDLAGGGDLDGDGISDIIVGAPFYDDLSAGVEDVGRAYVIPGSGTPMPPINLSDGFVHQLSGNSEYSGEAGNSVAGAGDVNADGYDDVIVGAHKENDPVLEAGSSYVLFGPITTDLSLDTANAKLTGGSVTGHLGVSVDGAGDVNADGFSDLIVGAKDEDIGGHDSGVVYVVFGPVSGTQACVPNEPLQCLRLGSGDPRIYGQQNHYLGTSLSGVGDTNGNGFDDVLLGTSGEGAFLLLGGDI